VSFAQTRERRTNLGKVRTARGLARRVHQWAERRRCSTHGDGGERLLAWYAAGDTDYRLPGTDMVFKVSAQTAELSASPARSPATRTSAWAPPAITWLRSIQTMSLDEGTA
jgi:hypothetical protein